MVAAQLDATLSGESHLVVVGGQSARFHACLHRQSGLVMVGDLGFVIVGVSRFGCNGVFEFHGVSPFSFSLSDCLPLYLYLHQTSVKGITTFALFLRGPNCMSSRIDGVCDAWCTIVRGGTIVWRYLDR